MILAGWNKPGDHELVVREINQYGCDSSVNKTIHVNKNPRPTVMGDKNSCVNEKKVYKAEGKRMDSIHWEVDNGAITQLADSQKVEVKWRYENTSGIQFIEGKVKARVVSRKGCDTNIQYPVRLSNVKAKISPAELRGCIPMNAVFSAHESVNATGYIWKLKEGVNKSGKRINHTFDKAGYNRIRLIASNGKGCYDTTFSEVILTPKPKADFALKEPDELDEYRLNDDRIVTKNNSEKANHFIWDFGDGFTSNQKSPVYEYGDTGNYEITLYATRQNGCMDSMSKEVQVIAEPYLYIPTAFSPDGDGINDHFSVEAINVYDFTVSIYNRWGERVFQSDDPDFKWDGTYKGKPVPMESYLYKVTAKGYQGEFLTKSGTVTVVK